MNLRRGLARLTTAVWAFGAILLLIWSSEVRQSLVDEVCRPEIVPPYPECYTESARELSETEGFAARAIARFRREWEQIDEGKNVKRYRTQRYREGLIALARNQAIWAVGTWGSFALLVWIGSGFRSGRSGEP